VDGRVSGPPSPARPTARAGARPLRCLRRGWLRDTPGRGIIVRGVEARARPTDIDRRDFMAGQSDRERSSGRGAVDSRPNRRSEDLVSRQRLWSAAPRNEVLCKGVPGDFGSTPETAGWQLCLTGRLVDEYDPSCPSCPLQGESMDTTLNGAVLGVCCFFFLCTARRLLFRLRLGAHPLPVPRGSGLESPPGLGSSTSVHGAV